MAEKRLLIFQTHGVGEPRRTYTPVFFGLTAAAMGMEVAIWFSMDGVTQLRKGAAEQVELEPGTGGTLKTWLDQARGAGGELLGSPPRRRGWRNSGRGPMRGSARPRG